MPAPVEWIAAIVQAAAESADVPIEVFDALIKRESNYDPNAVGSAGEVGLGQLKEAAAAEVGVNRFVPAENARGAALYLRKQYDATGNWYDALRAYNAGPAAAKADLEAGRAYAAGVLESAGYGQETGSTMTGPWRSNIVWPEWLRPLANLSTISVSAAALLLIVLGIVAIVFSARRAIGKAALQAVGR